MNLRKIQLLFVVVLFLSTYCAKFDITSVSQCDKQEGGICTKWTQTGQVIEQTAACFPGDTQVLSQEGKRIKMSDLRIGDKILTIPSGCTYDCQPYYTQVTGWFHKDKSTTFKYIWALTEDYQGFTSSPYHNIATEGWTYIFGKDLIGKNIIGLEKNQKVISVNGVYRVGAFSPMTESKNYLIFKQNSNNMVLAHSYAHITNPVFYQPFVDSIIFTYETIWGGVEDDKIIHPAAQWMMKTFTPYVKGVSQE